MAELRGPDSMQDTDDGASGAPEPGESYSNYPKLPALLALQTPLATPAVHDEMLFIIVHHARVLVQADLVRAVGVGRRLL